jgi:hypothetical protein
LAKVETAAIYPSIWENRSDSIVHRNLKIDVNNAWPQIELSQSTKTENQILARGLQFFGLAYFEPSEVGDCFAEELMADIPDDQRCLKFAYLVVENYIGISKPLRLTLMYVVVCIFKRLSRNTKIQGGPELICSLK